MFIVLEGSDGSGKTTQFKLLAERLRAAGHEVDVYDFPRYDEPSSYFVKRYLNGEYGPASEVSPYTASLFYALDRFEAAPLIRQSLAGGKIVLADRYTGSNMAHQGAKFSKSGEQRGFFVWADSLEFQLLGIPRPTINIFLRVPAEVSHGLIEKRKQIRHEHENDIEHLRSAVSAFDTLCQLFTKDFRSIECSKNGKLLPVTEINNCIWDVLKPMLPAPKHAGHSAVISLSDKPQRDDEQKNVEPVEPAAKTDLGLEESFELKDVSLLALNNLFARGLDIEYQLKWPAVSSKPRLTYYIPAEFPVKLAEKYRLTMERLASLSSNLGKSLSGSSKRYLTQVVPLAALVNAKVSGSHESTSQLMSQALAVDLTELRQITKRTRAELKEPQALRQIIKQMAEGRLDSNSASANQRVKLLSAIPRNEMDLLADCLYSYSNLSRDEIAAEIDGWPYEQKAKALKVLCSSEANLVLKKLSYRFDVIDDILALEKLTKLLKPSETQIQAPTPRYGYRVPREIEDSGVEESYIECFDLSLELYSNIQAAGFEHLAGYAVLLGHRQRWQLSTTGEAIFKTYQDVGFGEIALDILKRQIAEVHPLIIESARSRVITSKSEEPDKTNSAKAALSKRSRRRRGTKSSK